MFSLKRKLLTVWLFSLGIIRIEEKYFDNQEFMYFCENNIIASAISG